MPRPGQKMHPRLASYLFYFTLATTTTDIFGQCKSKANSASTGSGSSSKARGLFGYDSFDSFWSSVFPTLSSLFGNTPVPAVQPAPILNGDNTCGIQPKPSESEYSSEQHFRIVRGKNAQPNSWPWMVAILLGENGSLGKCGGALISPTLVVTAAHCLQRANPKNYTVVVGAHTMDGSSWGRGTTVDVQMVIPHAEFSSQVVAHDIGLIRLEEPVTFSNVAKPVCLPSSGSSLPEKIDCVIAGWGRTTENARTTASVLQEAFVQTMSNDICRRRLRLGESVNEKNICAGSESDACQGDSGGPLVCKNGQQWVVQGITSWGEGCGRPGLPGVYTRVSTYVDWIKQYL